MNYSYRASLVRRISIDLWYILCMQFHMNFPVRSNLMEISFVSMITMEGTCSFTQTHVFFWRRNQKTSSLIHVMYSCRFDNAVTFMPMFFLFLPFVNHGNQTFPIISYFLLQSIFDKGVKNVLKYNGLDPIECLELHLKEITLNSCRGRAPDVNFAKFFVLNARVLKVMRFGFKFTQKDAWWASQQKRLQLNDKGSAAASFELRHLSIFFDRFGLGGIKRSLVHDLSVADPFAASF